jgi:hypothetical protein
MTDILKFIGAATDITFDTNITKRANHTQTFLSVTDMTIM